MKMNWYKKAQSNKAQSNNDIQKFITQFSPKSLSGLAAEALKNSTFEEFQNNFLGQIKHGTYWHLTDNPNFTIDIGYAPRDMSSMTTGTGDTKGLMVTSHLENWISQFPNRKYVAEIDLSAVDPTQYKQVARGFGNEFFVFDPSKVKVIQVLPINQALQVDKYRHKKLPQSSEALQSFYEIVKEQYSEFIQSQT